MLPKARELNLFRDLCVGAGDIREEVTHLLFVDDVLLPCVSEKEPLLNLRCVLMGFQAVSGPNINLVKSELVRLGMEEDLARMASVLGCSVSNLPIRHLGIPLGAHYKETKT